MPRKAFLQVKNIARKKGLDGPQDQPQILSSRTQHHMHGIARTAFEPVAIEQPVSLHVANQGLDHTASAQLLASLLSMRVIPGPLTGDHYLGTRPGGTRAPIALVDHHRLDQHAGVQPGMRQ